MAQKLTLDPRYVFLILPSYAVFVIFNFLAKALGDGSLSLGKVEYVPHFQIVEATARYKVLTAAVFDVAVALAILQVHTIGPLFRQLPIGGGIR